MPVQKLLTVKLGSSRVYTLGWLTKWEGPANLSTHPSVLYSKYVGKSGRR